MPVTTEEKQRATWDEKLQNLSKLSSSDFNTYTPKSMQEAPADQHYINTLYKNGYHLQGEAWRSRLIPEGSKYTIRVKSTDTRYHCIRAYNNAALLWPLKFMYGQVWGHDLSVSKLTYYSLMKFEDVEVVVMEINSPMNMAVSGRSGECMGNRSIASKAHKPMTVLDAQCLRGFAGIPEYVMKKILTDKLKVPVPEAAKASDDDFLLDLKVLAIKHLKKTWKRSEVQRAIVTCWHLENPDGENELWMDPSIIADVLPHSESQKVFEYADQFEMSKKKKTLYKALITNAVQKQYPLSKAEVDDRAKPCKYPAVPKYKWKAGPGGTELEAAKAHIEKFKPHLSHVKYQEEYGRAVIVYPERKNKSFSWTRRGMEGFTESVLSYVWAEHSFATGDMAPWPIAA